MDILKDNEPSHKTNRKYCVICNQVMQYTVLNKLIFVVSLVNKWNNRSAHCMAGVQKCALRLFHLFHSETKNSTFNSYNLFHDVILIQNMVNMFLTAQILRFTPSR